MSPTAYRTHVAVVSFLHRLAFHPEFASYPGMHLHQVLLQGGLKVRGDGRQAHIGRPSRRQVHGESELAVKLEAGRRVLYAVSIAGSLTSQSSWPASQYLARCCASVQLYRSTMLPDCGWSGDILVLLSAVTEHSGLKLMALVQVWLCGHTEVGEELVN